MYLRTVKTKTKSGMREYLQLCHNYRKDGVSKTNVLYNFGRKDQVDIKQIRRLIHSLFNLLPEDDRPFQVAIQHDLHFKGSKDLGGTYFLDQVWKRLQIDKIIKQLLQKYDYSTWTERVIFGMVANCALAPSSNLHMEEWVEQEVYIADMPKVQGHQLYQGRDFLLKAWETIQKDVFFSVVNLLQLDMDLLFLDTMTTCFETTERLEDGKERNPVGFYKLGSKWESNPSLPQVVTSFAITKANIPVHSWVWLGNKWDQSILEKVKKDLKEHKFKQVVMLLDSGFNSKHTQILKSVGIHYIIGEKISLPLDPYGISSEVLKAKGSFKTIENGLQIKEITVKKDSDAAPRYIIVHIPNEAEYDKKKRNYIIEEVKQRLEELKQLEGEPHEKTAYYLRAHSIYAHYIRQTKTGQLILDKSRIKQEEKYDGKYLICTSNDGLSTKDIVVAYRQHQVIKRVFGDLRHVIDVRPTKYPLEDTIKVHVLLCWLAILMITIVENETDMTWFHLRKILSSISLGTFSCPQGEIYQTSPLSADVKRLFKLLKINTPPKFFKD